MAVHGQAVEDAAQAVLVCWNDPKLAALARSDEAFRDEAMSEILQLEQSMVPAGLGSLARPGTPPRFAAGLGRCSPRVRRGGDAGTIMADDDLLASACLLRLKGDDEAARRYADEVRGLPEPAHRLHGPDGTPIPEPSMLRCASGSASSTTCRPSHRISSRGPRRRTSRRARARRGTSWAQPSSAPAGSTRRSAGSSSRWQSEPDWPNHGLNAYGLALAHHRLGHPDQARRWLDVAERWLDRLDRIYTVEGPGVLTGQPPAPVSFEFWVYAQVLRREAAGPILDRSFPADPFAR